MWCLWGSEPSRWFLGILSPPEAATSVTCTCSEQQSFSEPPTVCKPCARGCHKSVQSAPTRRKPGLRGRWSSKWVSRWWGWKGKRGLEWWAKRLELPPGRPEGLRGRILGITVIIIAPAFPFRVLGAGGFFFFFFLPLGHHFNLDWKPAGSAGT